MLLLDKVSYIFAKVLKKSRMSAVLNSNVHKTSKIESGSQFVNSSIDKYSFCGYNCDINNTVIGPFTSIANGVVIGGGMHPIDWVSTSPVFYSGRDSVTKKFSQFKRVSNKVVHIGADVWIGQNVIIKQGVNIGHGAVIGMGSIVTKDVEPYTIVAGNPARLIRPRFNFNVSSRLLSSEWWLLDEQTILKAAKHIQNPIDFLSEIGK